MNANKFLHVYRKLANNQASTSEVGDAWVGLRPLVKGTAFENQFESARSRTDMALAIDALAAALHKNPEYAKAVFGDCDVLELKKGLDQLSGMEDESDVRRQSRGFFSTLNSEDEFEVV